MTPRRALVAALALLLVAPAAAGPERGGAAGRPRPAETAGGPRAVGGPPARLEALRLHTESEALGSEVALRRTDRDATRRAETALAPAPATRADVAALRDRALREEEQDALRTRVDWERLEIRAGRRLGPVTRRVLERSDVALVETERAADLADEARARDAELRRRELREPAF